MGQKPWQGLGKAIGGANLLGKDGQVEAHMCMSVSVEMAIFS